MARSGFDNSGEAEAGHGEIHLGIDAGSTTVKVVVTDEAGRLLESDYRYAQGQPARTLLMMLADLGRRRDLSRVVAAGITGSGGALLAPLLGALRVNELVAQVHALESVGLSPRSVVEIGGQDSKLLRLEPYQGGLQLIDFAMNNLCAAGTGAFLDRQAERLGLSIEQFAALALHTNQPARIAGRCAVFGRSDLVHLQQQGVPTPDLIAGLCLAVARTVRATLGGGRPFHSPVAFQGGVALNAGMVWALEQVLGLEPGTLVIPPYCTLMPALGAATAARSGEAPTFRGLEALAAFAVSPSPQSTASRPPLPGRSRPGEGGTISPPSRGGQGRGECYLGLDVGSISTKVVALDRNGRLLAGCYLPTAGRPVTVARQARDRVVARVGDLAIAGTGITGSGRHLVAQEVGGEVFNEITAQARAACACHPGVDTVLEIGGQDSKYIALRDGVISDHVLNKACAAGTGAFLEEQALRLGVPVEGLADLAFESTHPADLAERCTVFAESDLVHHQQQGVAMADLAAGLAYAVARNYLARVVDGRAVGCRVLFQGGVALNPAVVAAFEVLLDRPVSVPPNPELSGAIGAALLARANVTKSTWHVARGTVHDKVGQQVEGGRGSVGRRPDLFAEREALLLADLDGQQVGGGGPWVGFPRVLAFYDLLPFWSCFFRELGWDVLLSPPTTPELATRSAAEAGAETCFPARLAYGHVLWLLEQGVDMVFLPAVVNRAGPLPGHDQSYHCPFIQAAPNLVEAALHEAGVHVPGRDVTLLHPPVHFLWPRVLARDLEALGAELGAPARRVTAARRAAGEAQHRFESALRRRGVEVLAGLAPDEVAAVLVGRAYSTADPGLNAGLPATLRRLGALPLPLDCLPLDNIDITGTAHNMFWHTGQRFLAAARVIRADPRLHAVYLTHFGCGPDSFLLSFFRQALGDKPFLTLELDDHSGSAGLLTRVEAFLESNKDQGTRAKGQAARPRGHPKQQAVAPTSRATSYHPRYPISRVYIPNVCDHTHALAAAIRAYGLHAEVLAPSTGETLALGRDLCLGRECLPCHTIVGDIVQRARQPGFDPARAAYLVPTSAGPCRLGQFHDLLRQVLGRLDLGELRVVAPSAENGYQYEGLGVPPLGVGRLAWRGALGVSLLEKLLLYHRPYECLAGSADRLYHEALGALVSAIESRQAWQIRAVVEEAARAFSTLDLDRTRPRPAIGVVGELYLRLNPFTNQQIVRRVEALGGEVWLAPMTEWVPYANHFSRFTAAAQRRYGKLARLHLIRQVLVCDERRLAATVDGALPTAHEPSTVDLLAAAGPYFHPVLRTEAPLTIGKAVDFYRHGADGILNVMPFTCMPGTVVAGLGGQIRADCDGLPWLDVSFDGLGETNLQTRLEAFMHQVIERHCTRETGARDGRAG
ncbi:MAG: CoA activase [Anaerolineae bacterium]|nr:CoA activase [Anaerolineae bacterium]